MSFHMYVDVPFGLRTTSAVTREFMTTSRPALVETVSSQSGSNHIFSFHQHRSHVRATTSEEACPFRLTAQCELSITYTYIYGQSVRPIFAPQPPPNWPQVARQACRLFLQMQAKSSGGVFQGRIPHHPNRPCQLQAWGRKELVS